MINYFLTKDPQAGENSESFAAEGEVLCKSVPIPEVYCIFMNSCDSACIFYRIMLEYY